MNFPVLDRRVTRRHFIQTGAAGSALLVGFTVPLRGRGMTATGPSMLSAWLRIAPDNTITIIVPSPEMGQGVSTSLPMLIAEELEADWPSIHIEFAPVDAAYANPLFHTQIAVGSASIRGFFMPLRKAGACAREMLRQAAANRWGVPISECKAANGCIIHESGNKQSFGALVADAAELPIPATIQLKPRSDWKLIGKSIARLDTPAKVDGSAVFGIDISVPGMLVATIAQCPVFGGTLGSVDEAPALAIRGVKSVVRLHTPRASDEERKPPNSIAVVGDSYCPVSQGLAALKPQWDAGANAALDSDAIRTVLQRGLSEKGTLAENQGDTEPALEKAAKKVDAVYSVPFLAHVTMEPMNATASVTASGCEVWAPTQAPSIAQAALAGILQMRPEQVKIHTTYLGGGFGRRAVPDVIVQAALISKAVAKPVKLIWSREEDMRHDSYRPASTAHLRAGLDSSGKLTAWDVKLVSPGSASFILDGATASPYAPEDRRLEYVVKDVGVPFGAWRSISNSCNAFYIESFVDELAYAATQDPYVFRRTLLADKPRHRAVLERAAAVAGWNDPLPAGHFRGIAMHAMVGTVVAHVVQISIINISFAFTASIVLWIVGLR